MASLSSHSAFYEAVEGKGRCRGAARSRFRSTSHAEKLLLDLQHAKCKLHITSIDFKCAGPGEGAERREYSGSRGAKSVTFLKVYSELNIYIYTYIYICICAYIYIYTCICIDIYITKTDPKTDPTCVKVIGHELKAKSKEGGA